MANKVDPLELKLIGVSIVKDKDYNRLMYLIRQVLDYEQSIELTKLVVELMSKRNEE